MRKYTKEFKITACELVLKDHLKTPIVAEKIGIHPVMLYRWVSEYQELEEDAFVGTGNQHKKDAQLRKMQKEIEDLRIENEILKKAAAYFAKHPKEK